ncbi:Kelch repeat-containing protein [Stieleria varia]|uniref:N-acetylneuraminate epimerase n=1 Tax=Stieleria varia TaxID=2528005 RepID=A0A5C6AG04_9BACT|nr:kelch repeat-containing protein [Stieleria varia]TWT98390.1 N-acetylneuraminate epimerase precursor [Stieleria varia]
MLFPYTIRFALIAVACLTLPTLAHAHMAWLSTDDDGHVVLWFGESPNDRTYHMPESIAKIELQSNGSGIETESVKNDSLVGIRSTKPAPASAEVAGRVTYGLYHGTKLTYHVEHLPQSDPSKWPVDARAQTPLQSVIRSLPEGGIRVTILHHEKPAKDLEVKLYCEEGHEEGAAKTDIAGMVTFTASQVEPGLNAIVVGMTDPDAKGTLDGEDYGSTTDYLTATFRIPGEVRGEIPSNTTSRDDASNPQRPEMDDAIGASVVPSNLPELPEELTSFGAAVSGQSLYVYGGHTGNAHSYSTQEQSNRFWCLDLSAGEQAAWQKRATGPSLQGLALVAHGDRIIRIGGFTAVNAAGETHDLRSQNLVAAYHPATNTWTDLPSLPEPRSSLDAAVLGDTVYVFGGWKLDGQSDDSQWHTTAWSLDLSDDTSEWQSLAQPPFQRRAISVAAHEGKLYVIGGMNSQGKTTTRVDIYDPSSNAWTQGPSLPGSGMSGFGSSSFATGGRLYVSTLDGRVHQLGEDGASWRTIAKCNPARFFHRMLPIADDELLMIGGANMEIGKFKQIDRIKLSGH